MRQERKFSYLLLRPKIICSASTLRGMLQPVLQDMQDTQEETVKRAKMRLTNPVDLDLNVVEGTPQLERSKDGLPPSHDVRGIPYHCILHHSQGFFRY